jgi:prolipoprotein diacylglyceryl transferase
MVLDFIRWNVNPDIFSIGPVTVRYYGLLFAIAFVVGYKIMEYVYKREGYPSTEVDRISIYMIFGVVIGARLGHVFFYEWSSYKANPIEILEIWKGGLASHGAAIGILIAMFIYTRSGPIRSYMWILDRIILTVPIGGFFVRLGNLMNSEIYGHVTNLPWGFYFPRDSQFDNMPHHPTQIYEALGYLAIFLLLFWLYRKKNIGKKPGMMFGLFLVLLFGLRFVVEFFKEVQDDWEHYYVNHYGLNMGQMLSIPFILIGIFIMIRAFRLTPEEKI